MGAPVQKISPGQFRLLVMLFSVGSSILLIPPALISASKEDGWISGAIGVSVGVLIILLYIGLIKSHPGKSYFFMLEKTFGKWIGKAISFLYILFIILLTCEVLSNLGDFMTTQIMVETPKIYIHLLFLIPIMYGVGQGIEVLARTAQAIYPTFILLLFFLIVFLIPEGQLENLEPVFGEGMKSIISGAFPILTVPYLEMFVLILISTYVTDKNKVGKSFIIGGIMGGAILILITFLIILVLGYSFSSLLEYPTYVLAKKINIADFLQRLEIIAAALWIISLFFKVSICFYSSVEGVREWMNLTNHRALIFPLGICVLYFSISVFPDSAYFAMIVNDVVFSYTLLFGMVIPLACFIVIRLKNKFSSKGTL
ncbi:GerAB/ArcD/ProY family transporter [Bacillus sp. KH172YL63]|uniref:GerAB/ArcD/ProY family transporter n=1 Tax=Bacillus sp. KH172YL63 TaxID=2709784 RepID=UPI0013E4EEC6|nr:endospore germination permease [Bacillus sp. KH172YL63]BCB04401.1 hypothetical protein KH172YL63_25340 [Bacillus sp. KH172YL63]